MGFHWSKVVKTFFGGVLRDCKPIFAALHGIFCSRRPVCHPIRHVGIYDAWIVKKPLSLILCMPVVYDRKRPRSYQKQVLSSYTYRFHSESKKCNDHHGLFLMSQAHALIALPDRISKTMQTKLLAHQNKDRM